MNPALRSGPFVLLLSASAGAQSFNIDIGNPGSAPSSSYAAAGRAGHWYSLVADNNSTTYNIVDVNNVVTGVSIWQYGGTAMIDTSDLPAGDDAALMNDCRVTYTPGLETCLFFYDLVPGRYIVLAYSRMPANSSVMSYVSSDEEPGYPHVSVGGAWPGHHQAGISYSKHIVNVTSGLLRVHSGIVPGNNPALGAAFNGIQIQPLNPADVNADTRVDIDDLVAVITAWGACANCANCPADVNHNCVVNIDDLVAVITNWG